MQEQIVCKLEEGVVEEIKRERVFVCERHSRKNAGFICVFVLYMCIRHARSLVRVGVRCGGRMEREGVKEKGDFICTKTLPVSMPSSHSVAVVLVSHSDAHQEGENGPIRFLEKSETSLRLFLERAGKGAGREY